jgi:polysaccharide deacetylase family protein (PEP-CTERM system associated)
MRPIVNAMTVDVEDYFQVSAFAKTVSYEQWPTFESRVCRNTERLLEIFDGAGIHATFFVLGWVAERFPSLVRRIHQGGHEIASHGYAHGLVYDATPETFRDDLRRAKDAIESAAGARVTGYRAPSYSIVDRSLWALDVLVSEGYYYDSSIYPIRHDRYGIPTWPRHIHRVERAGGVIWELPGSTVRRAGMNLPIGGGGYFRMLPYRWTSSGIRMLNDVEARPAIFYLHPWEIDPAQPRISAPMVSRLRHYTNVEQMETRLRRLISEFRFGTISHVLDGHRH